MPLTALDRCTAVIVIDLQKGLAGYLSASVFSAVIERSRALTEAFRARGLPVVLVTADGLAPGRTEQGGHLGVLPPGFADLVDELAPQPGDILVVKRTWGAFTNSDLAQRLKALGVTQIVLTGIATSFGVESTARQAYEAGFNVTVAVDAVADPRVEAHENSLMRIFPALGETGSAADVIGLLESR